MTAVKHRHGRLATRLDGEICSFQMLIYIFQKSACDDAFFLVRAKTSSHHYAHCPIQTTPASYDYSNGSLRNPLPSCTISHISPLFLDERGDSISVNSHQEDNFPSLGGISSDYTGVHHEPLHAFGEKDNIFEAEYDHYDEISWYTFYRKTDNNELKRIKFILKIRGWNIDSRNNSANMIVLDECNIMRILMICSRRAGTLLLLFTFIGGRSAAQDQSRQCDLYV
ncbi:hypothetical protein RJ639_032461 [Escallonia herrerae]|uniref:Uncharacterized protein n=1 Tax=Escallonia herrerae TaxID=1293975 RepID=A0AA88X9P6_9ASTE|nr:hypothetical protein RJ639_032461 [Escallonia herrerae]